MTGFELTKRNKQAITNELESHQTRRTSKETQDETQDTTPKHGQHTVHYQKKTVRSTAIQEIAAAIPQAATTLALASLTVLRRHEDLSGYRH